MRRIAKSRYHRRLSALLAATAIVIPAPARAQTVAADKATQVYNAANGVPIVDIAKANGSGLSHNRFNSYNVDTRGMVLNNGDMSQVSHASQLAGQVASNPNLTRSARVVLNEVVTTNRSALNGYTEVVGKNADVVVANPNGITCNGCGFINTSNVSLTTGKPLLGASGALNGFRVDKGDILITGKGLDASAQDNLALVSRSAKIDAQINAKNLDVITGVNDVDYVTHNATARSADPDAPDYAVDSSALGGMYANRIRLVATEAGVGVRMLGDAAAGVDDFTIDADGKVELGNKISAERDVRITSAGSDVETTNAKMSAKRDTLLNAASGAVTLRGGTITAGETLAIDSATLNDQKTTSSDSDNNKRHGKTVTSTQTGAATLQGVSYSADEALGIVADSLSVVGSGTALVAGTTLDATTNGALALNDAALQSSGNLTLTSTNGAVTTTGGTGQGIISSAGNISLNAATGLNNGGKMSAETGQLVARIGNQITNGGTLFGKTGLDIADGNNASAVDITNAGTLLSHETLTIKADDFTNTGDVQGTKGVTIQAGTLDNSGKLILSNNNAYSGSISANTLTNSGLLQSANDLTLTLANAFTNSDRVLAGHDLLLRAGGASALNIASNGGRLQAANRLSIKGLNGGNNASITAQAGTLLADTLDFNLSALANSGTIQGGTGASQIFVANTLTNNTAGKIYLATSALASGTVNAATLNNYGILQSAGEMALNIGTQLSNGVAGKIYAVKKLVLRGLNDAAYSIVNSKLIQSDDLLDIKGKNGTAAVTINNNASGAAMLGKTVDMKAGTVTLANGSDLASLNNLTLNATSLTVSGSNAHVVAGKSGTGSGTISLSGDLTNNGGIFGAQDFGITATNLTNSSTAGIGANRNLTVNASNLYNYGSLYAASLLDATISGTLQNYSSGTIDADNDANLRANIFENNNDIVIGRNLTVNANTFKNQISGGDQRSWGANSAVSNSTGGWSRDPDWLVWGQSATRTHTSTWNRAQSYDVTPGHRPQLVANNAMTITNFTTGLNLGGNISAPTLNINTTKPGATFTNDEYGLLTENYTRTYTETASCCTDVIYITYSNGTPVTSHTTTGGAIVGAGIFAGTLNASGFSLSNKGSPVAAAVENYSASAGNGDSSLGATTNATGIQPGVTFGGITLTLPTNPNGFFVVSKDPNSKFLVETNPLYTSSTAGSQYLLDRLGLNPDMVQRRLGDGNYETSLIRQQLVKQVGKGVLIEGETEDQQMLRLMNSGADEGKKMGLTLGKAPSSEQLANLDHDMVWMVETEVGGQKVLAPVVYLSAQTKTMIAGNSGPTIAAKNMNMDLASLTNTGGTISGSNTLNVRSQGDIKNTSGTITGGNVSLSSTNGSIINETYANTTGGEGNQQTDIGKRASITSTGDLTLDAKQDITNKGADMNAGGNASLNAGNNITFDTIEDKKSSASQDGRHSASESTTTNVKSGLNVGGNLATSSGNDTTFAGTDVDVKGNADVKAGGDLNIIARDDKKSTSSHSESGDVFSGSSHDEKKLTTTNVGSTFNVGGNLTSDSKGDTTIQGSKVDVKGDGDMKAGGNFNVLDGHDTSNTVTSDTNTGLGVGGGVYGTNTEEDKNRKSTSVGSNLSFGGNGNISSDKSVTVQGSTVEAGGDLGVKAKENINVIEGRDIDESSHTSTTVTFGKVYDGESSVDNKSGSGAGTNGASAKAEASASSERNGSGGVSVMEANVTQTDREKSTAKGSSLKSGGNMNIEAGGDTTLRGANVDAGGDLGLSGTNVNIEAAKDTDTSSTRSTTTQVGFYAESKNQASAGAEAGAEADAGKAKAQGKATKEGGGASANAGDASAKAGASANASATTDNTLDFMRGNTTTTDTKDVTHQGTTIKSGGNTTIKAKDTVNVAGSSVDAKGDLNVDAKDINVTAVHDTHDTKTTSDSTRAGMYNNAGVEANADVGAHANAKGLDARANASASVEANVESGYQVSNTKSETSEGSSTAKTSSLKSGGNMTRNAENKITDEGAQIEAGGDYSQSSKEWESKAAADTSYSSSTTETNTGKLGGYAKAGAGAEYGANSKGEITNESGADASAGVKATYEHNKEKASEASSTAVVSTIKSGGKMTTNTTGTASLEGTQLESGGDMEVNAGTLDYKAARDTKTSSTDTTNANAELSVGVDARKKVTGTIAGGYEGARSEDTSSTAVVGGMKSGGNMKVNTTGDARFEGTNIEAKDDVGIKAGGSVKMDAARDTSTHTESGENASASLSLSKGGKGKAGGKGSQGMGLNAEGGFDKSESSEDNAVAGSIKSGGKMDISAGQDASFEGTKIDSGGDMSVDAKGNVDFKAAKSTKKEEGYGGSANISMSKGGKDKKGKANSTNMGAGIEGHYDSVDEESAEEGSLNSGGKLTVKSGKDMSFEGTTIESKDKTSLDAGRDLNFKAKEDKANNMSVEAGVELSKTKAAKGGNKAENGSEAGLSAGIEGKKENTKTGGSIKAGEIEMKSGRNTTLEGTDLDSKGDTSIKSGGDTTFKAAKSTSIDGSFKGNVGSGGTGMVDEAGIGGGVSHDTSKVNTGGNLKVESGGKTTLEGTKADVGGKAVITGKNGVEKKTVVSGGGEIGMTRAGANVDVQQTTIKSGSGAN